MDASDHGSTTAILDSLVRGEEGAADRLLPLVYDELRELAAKYFHRGPSGNTLQPTALVHEAYLRLVDLTGAEYNSRAHFMGVAAKAMRHILVDRARRRATVKHGGACRHVTLDEALIPDGDLDVDVLALDEALQKLAQLDERKSRIIELRFFAGLGIADTAEALGVARSTVTEDWRMARAWLACELGYGKTP